MTSNLIVIDASALVEVLLRTERAEGVVQVTVDERLARSPGYAVRVIVA